MSDSSTGGFITPVSTTGELNDDALTDFLQSVVVGIVGLPGNLVRPRWQPEPPGSPATGTNWAAVGVMSSKPDTFAYVIHHPGFDATYRQDILEICCTFYGPNSRGNCNLLSMGFQIEQNLEQFQLNNFSFISCDSPIYTAELDNNLWVPRVDLTFRLRRAQIYHYPILDLAGSQVQVQDDTNSVNAAANVKVTTELPQPLPLFAWGLSSGMYAGWGQGTWK